MCPSSERRQLAWLREPCDCPSRPSKQGDGRSARPDPDCFHGLLVVVIHFQGGGKSLVENDSGFVKAFRNWELVFDPKG